jgi:hypothetical protein
VLKRGSALLLVSVLASACGDSTTGPSSSTSTGGVPILVVFTPVGGSYTASLNNQTFTAAGGFTVPLAPGTYTITGSFVGQGFGVGFATSGTGGVVSGSVRHLSGPTDRQVKSCDILYFNIDTPSTRRSFQVQFQVSSNVGTACQGF